MIDPFISHGSNSVPQWPQYFALRRSTALHLEFEQVRSLQAPPPHEFFVRSGHTIAINPRPTMEHALKHR